MASKLQFYSALADRTINDLTAKRGNWTLFLNSAAWLYKYPFQDQMMIYAQRPEATACAELELWNEHFNRWVQCNCHHPPCAATCIPHRALSVYVWRFYPPQG